VSWFEFLNLQGDFS